MLVENALFATLDPTVRRARTPDGRDITLTDTVGFVRHLPHELIEAFRSTLEEVADADLILHVVDGSHPDPESQLAAVRGVLADIDAHDVPELVVINKADIADPLVLSRLLPPREAQRRRLGPHRSRASTSCSRPIDRDLPRPDVEVDVLLPVRPGRPRRPGPRHRRGDQRGARRRRHARCAPGSDRPWRPSWSRSPAAPTA